MLVRRSLVFGYTCFIGMKFSNWIVSAEEGSFILVRVIRITWKVDNSDTGVATNEVRTAPNDAAIFRLLNCYVFVTTTEVITRYH